MPQPWLPRVETEPSMAEWGIEGATPGRSFPLEEAKGFQGLRQVPKHHPAILTSQMQSQHPLQRAVGITLLNVGSEEETNGGPRYQPSDEMVGEGGEASWTQVCSLKPHNSALLAALGVPKLIDGVLFCRFSRKDGMAEHTQLIVPRKLRDEIEQQMHSSLLSGHLGKCKTMERVIQHFYWFGVREDCDLWVEKCDICA